MLNFDWLADLSLITARLLLIAAFLIALFFGLMARKDYIYTGSKNIKEWRDFRIWIVILVVIQVILYSAF